MSTKPVTIEFYFDTRRKKKNGKYPLKLRVYHEGRGQIYKIGYDLSKEEYQKIFGRKRPKGEYRELGEELETLKAKARREANQFEQFTFEAFEARFFRSSEGKGNDPISLGEQMIGEFQKEGRTGTAESYQCAIRSFGRFLKEKKRKKSGTCPFKEVSKEVLNEYERWMMEEEGRSQTTVGIYTRTLRAIFNRAREDGLTDQYPFGRRKYQTPNPKKTKKALSMEELNALIEAEPNSWEQERARDLFFLSFLLQGINMQDLMNLRNKDIDEAEGKIQFFRQKTRETAKGENFPVVVPLTEQARSLIEKYRNTDHSPDAHLFVFASDSEDLTERRGQVKSFIGAVNQKLKKLAMQEGLPEEISWQWARHTYATLSITVGGASMEHVSQALGHNDMATTKAYFAGFSKDYGKEVMDKMLQKTFGGKN